jgi:hypothetical protein
MDAGGSVGKPVVGYRNHFYNPSGKRTGKTEVITPATGKVTAR